MSLERRESWSRYWSAGALHSCSGSFLGNYAGEVREFWRDAVSDLVSGSKLLDIATGNGALPHLITDLLTPEFDFELDAVDLAEMKAPWLASMPPAQRRRLRFHSGVAAERLPFADVSMDLVVSQFGLEYTELPRSLAEVNRVLRPKARLALIVHAKNSLIASQAREELAHIGWMGSEVQLFDLAVDICGLIVEAATPEGRRLLANDAAANRLREKFNRAMAAIKERAETSYCPDVLFDTQKGIVDAFAASVSHRSESVGRERIAQLVLMQSDNEFRLRELLECALDQVRVEDIVEQAGCTLESLCCVRFESGDLMGWGVLARKD